MKKRERRVAIDFKPDLVQAAKERLRDTPAAQGVSDEQLQKSAVAILEQLSKNIEFPSVRTGMPLDSQGHQSWLMSMQWWATSSNVKANKLRNIVFKDSRFAFATVKELQRELIGLLSDVAEEEQKILGNYSKVHFNSFVRSMDQPMQWGNKLMLKDYKTGYPYKEKYLMDVINDAGLSLPIKGTEDLPIRDIYIVDELSDTGDTMYQVQKSDPMNLTRSNKNFHYVLLRKEYDHSSRKFKTQTNLGTYPYSCVSTLTLEIEFPSFVQINYFRFEPIADSTVHIPPTGLSYRSIDGSDITLNSVSIPGETSTTLIFQPIWSRYLRISFEQYGTVGRTELPLGDKRKSEINKILDLAGFTTRLPNTEETVKGRVYDFSLAKVAAGFFVFQPKGIFRSGTPIRIDSPVGFDLKWEAEQLTPIESFETYLKTATFPEGRVLLESYLDIRLYGGDDIAAIYQGDKKRKITDMLIDTLVVDSLVPIPDSYPLQMEFLVPIVHDAKLKLFPNFRWNQDKFVVSNISLLVNYISISNETAGTMRLLEDGKSKEEISDIHAGFAGTLLSGQVKDYTTGTLPYGVRYDSEINEHVAAENSVLDAIKGVVAAKRPDIERAIEVTYIAPSEDDLKYLLGSYYADADLSLKYEIETRPEHYLLLSDNIISGTNRYLKNLTDLSDNKVATILARTCRKMGTDQKGYVHDCFSDTKMLALDVVGIESSLSLDSITVKMRAVKSLDEIHNLRHLSIKHREQARKTVSIHSAAKDIKDFLTSVALGEFDKGNVTKANGGGIIIAAVGEAAKLFSLLMSAVSRNTWALELIPPESDGGIFSKKNLDYSSWAQLPADRGSTIYDAVRFNSEQGLEVLKTLSYSEIAKTYSLEESNDFFYPDPTISEDLVYTRIYKNFKYSPSTNPKVQVKEIIAQTNLATYPELTDWEFSQYRTFTDDEDSETPGEYLEYKVRDEILKLVSVINFPIALWRFSIEEGHDINIGDVVSFYSVPSDFLGGEYNVVDRTSTSFDIRINNLADGSLNITDLSLANAVAESNLMPNLSFTSGSWDDKANPFSMSSDGTYSLYLELVASQDLLLHEELFEIIYKILTSLTGIPEANLDINLNPDVVDVVNFFMLLVPDFRNWSEFGKIIWMPNTSSDLQRERGLFALFEMAFDFNKALRAMNTNPYHEIDLITKAVSLISFYDSRVIHSHRSSDSAAACPIKYMVQDMLMDYTESSGLYENFPLTRVLCSGYQESPFDVYENDVKLIVGEDYLISLNEKADWLAFWPTDGSLDKYWEGAAAGRCFVKIKGRDPSALYWVKYRVHGEQLLSDEGKIFLRNGRVTCDDTLVNGSSGTVNVVILARTNSYNPYITPILRNYSLRIQEKPGVKRVSGRLDFVRMFETSRSGTHVD